MKDEPNGVETAGIVIESARFGDEELRRGVPPTSEPPVPPAIPSRYKGSSFGVPTLRMTMGE